MTIFRKERGRPLPHNKAHIFVFRRTVAHIRVLIEEEKSNLEGERHIREISFRLSTLGTGTLVYVWQRKVSSVNCCELFVFGFAFLLANIIFQ